MKPTITSSNAAITVHQLADLLGVDPSNIGRKAQLPTTYEVHTGTPGKPQLCFSLADLAELIQARTGNLSDVECRLRLALMNKCARAEPSASAWRHGQFQLLTRGDGSVIAVPTNVSLDRLEPDIRELVMVAVREKQADVVARRDARKQARSAPPELQP